MSAPTPRSILRVASRLAPLFATLLLGIACDDQTPQALDQRIIRLMQCQECNSGEQAAVVAMGDSAVPALLELLLNGPPGAFIAQVDSALHMPVDTGGAPFIPPAQSIQRLLDDYRTIYRVRSSHALGAMVGDSARHAICAAKAQGFSRPEVNEALNSALALAGGLCP